MPEARERPTTSTGAPRVRVVLFTGGRGSEVLSKELIRSPGIALTLAINGYDDGASTGEVRRFLGDCLGPSDYRKNASRLARELGTCDAALVDLLDTRFPEGFTEPRARAALRRIAAASTGGGPELDGAPFDDRLAGAIRRADPRALEAVTARLAAFERELDRTGRPFDFSDCSLGNLVFAGSFLLAARAMNAAIADYCSLLGLPDGLIENVTDGTNAYLVALDRENRLLSTEEEIVDAANPHHIRDIFLVDRPPTPAERERLARAPLGEILEYLDEHTQMVAPNPVLLARVEEADIIIYSPGTQYSSLYPSYLTPGVGSAIARNLNAIKLLITNIREDAESRDSNAVAMIDRAVYYLRNRNRHPIPTPCLITHYLLNDPNTIDAERPYIPLGEIEQLEDPRLIRIGNYEDGITGRHNAVKVLTPFIQSYLERRHRPKVGVLLLETSSPNKIAQTMLEMLRGGLRHVPASPTVFYEAAEPLPEEFTRALPFRAVNVYSPGEPSGSPFAQVIRSREFDYFVLFESSGMYKGEDVVNLLSHLALGRLDAVWGSRRLSVRDIHESYRLRYRHRALLGAISYLGSHALSLIYLLLYGRYVADTLSACRAVRASYLSGADIDLDDRCINQKMLSILLRDRADVLEIPVQFFPIAPEKVRRTTIRDGLRSLATILWWRLRAPRIAGPDPHASAVPERERERGRLAEPEAAATAPRSRRHAVESTT